MRSGMSIFSTTAIAFSMSADAFAVSVATGAGLRKPRWRDALRSGAVFGIVEAITPIIGWCIGLTASRYIEAVDHWFAFAILGAVGGKLIWESFRDETPEEEKPQRHGLGILIVTAIGTSIDALAVGVTLAFIDASIWISAAAIGSATFLMASIGFMTGHYIGSKAGKYAELAGGLALIGIGTHILLSHLGII